MIDTETQSKEAGRFVRAEREEPVIVAQHPEQGHASEALEWIYPAEAYEAEVRLHPEPTGGYSAYAPLLPGVASQGETLPEALANIKEALLAAIESYRESGCAIPWLAEAPAPEKDEIQKWIVVRG